MSVLAQFVSGTDALKISQKKEWAEILVGYDVANRFSVLDDHGRVLGEVLEEGGGLWAAISRNVFGTFRTMVLHLRDPAGQEVATFRKKPSIFFHRLEVSSHGTPIGTIRRRFSLLGRKYGLYDAAEREVASIKRPLFRLWTYPVLGPNGRTIATIGKKWGGVLKEVFTDADTYGVAFEPGVPAETRGLIFAAMFLVDLTNTENNAGSGGLLSMFTE